MGTGIYSADGTVADRVLHYLEARSKGGVGLIISEGMKATKYTNYDLMLHCEDDRFIPSMRSYAEAARRYGARVFLQVTAPGGKDSGVGYAPSSIDDAQYSGRPRELTLDQITDIVQDFVNAAVRAQKSGFDGVEVDASTSFLVAQFLSPHFNKRDDDYGGDFERRMRFLVDIVRGIKRHCGHQFPMGVKLGVWEEMPHGIDHELGVKIAQRIAIEGVAYLHPQTTAYYPPVAVRSKYPTMSPMYSPRNTLLSLAENLKRNVRGVPIATVGGILDPREADDIIAREKADMIVIGRAILADPEWAIKAQQGKRIRPCIRCNVCHHEVAALGGEMVCTVNPYLTHEPEEHVTPTLSPKSVAVVGAGPGGIVAALIASRRGHRVRLFEEKSEIGGLLIPGSAPDIKNDLGALLRYYREEIDDSNVQVETNKRVTADLLRQTNPDVLVIAVGARPIRPSIPGADGENVITAVTALNQGDRISGQRVVIIGGGEVGCETAIHLSRRRNQVVIVEILDSLLALADIKNNVVVLEELLEQENVESYTGSKVVEIGRGSVKIIDSAGRPVMLPSDIVVLALGLELDNQSIEQFRASCPKAYLVGDCVEPRRIFEAVHDANRVARLI